MDVLVFVCSPRACCSNAVDEMGRYQWLFILRSDIFTTGLTLAGIKDRTPACSCGLVNWDKNKILVLGA
jgi:hypothetical protein